MHQQIISIAVNCCYSWTQTVGDVQMLCTNEVYKGNVQRNYTEDAYMKSVQRKCTEDA